MTRQEEINKMAKEVATYFASDEDVQAAFRDVLIRGAEWADAHPYWISVEDELPPKESEYDDNSIVVLATDGNGVYKGLYRSGEYLSGWFTYDLWALDNITHWMPMPQVPILSNSSNIGKDLKGDEE